MLACAKMLGWLPAGPLPAATAGPGSELTCYSYAAGAGGVGAGSGTAVAGTSAGATGVDGGVFSGSGLAGAASPLPLLP